VSNPQGYDYFDVAADVGVAAWGPTLEEAFRQAGLGVFALVAELAGVEEREARELLVSGGTREDLLVNWINECLYLHDIEGFLPSRIEFPIFSEGRLLCRLWGEPLDSERHRPGILIKAATYHQLTVAETAKGWEIRVILDV
jgi:SHS2 domain-containing protein